MQANWPKPALHVNDILPQASVDGDNGLNAVSAYLDRCRQALTGHPDSLCVMPGTSALTLAEVQPGIGLLLHDNAPAPFKTIANGKQTKRNCLLFPYTQDGILTFVTVTHRKHFPIYEKRVRITEDNVGVFMEPLLTGAECAYCTFDPAAAVHLHANLFRDTRKQHPVVALSGFPLPASIHALRKLLVVVTRDSPLSLSNALGLLKAVSPENQNRLFTRAPGVSNYITVAESTTLYAHQITPPPLSLQRIPHGASLVTWIIRKINTLITDNLGEEAHETLNAAQLTPDLKAHINRAAVALQLPEVVKLLERTESPPALLTLANGKTFRNCPTSIEGINAKNAFIPLANAGITMRYQLHTQDRGDIYVCDVLTASHGPVEVRLGSKELKNADRLQAAIRHAFTNKGLSPYITFYDAPKYRWSDILAKLAESQPIYPELHALGATPSGAVNFPHIELQADGAVVCQKQIITLPEPVTAAYDGLQAVEPILDPYDPFLRLFKSCDNLYTAALIIGLMHWCHVVVDAVYARKAGVRLIPRHLLFVETEAGIWTKTFQQLYRLFAGQEHPPQLRLVTTDNMIKDYVALGTLPLIAALPSLRGDRLEQLLNNTPHSILGLVSGGTATTAGNDFHTSYVTPGNAPLRPIYAFSLSDIRELQEALPQFLSGLVSRITSDSELRNAAIPAITLYERVCALLELPPVPLVAATVHSYFPGLGAAGADAFFLYLHQLIELDAKNNPVGIVTGKLPERTGNTTISGHHIFITDTVVALSQMIPAILNEHFRKTRFNAVHLTDELSRRNMLISTGAGVIVDPQRYWVISKALWDKEVMRPPIQLKWGDGADEITLKRLSG